MTLAKERLTSTLNPLADLGTNADDCIKRLVFGAGIKYISTDLVDACKSIAVNLASEAPEMTVRQFVDALHASHGSAINGLADVADAITQAYLA